MLLSFNDTDPDSIEVVADEIPGVEVALTIFGVFDPGQIYVASTCRDPLGQEAKEAEFEINRVEVYVTEDWQQRIDPVHISDQLKAADFYSEVIRKIEEGL